jgi:ABC-2 type transport system ATP-binding protein
MDNSDIMDDSDRPIITVHNLVKKYSPQDSPVLDNICLSIHRGEFFGLLGPNGAGKTTLISILCGILKPDQGRVDIFGIDIMRHIKKVKKRIGLVTQDIALYEELTARENLKLFGCLYGLRGKHLRERIETCLDITGLGKKADCQVSTFSGGMKRLTNLVISMLHEPDILILDEPTLGIDTQSRYRILKILSSVNKNGVSMIYTSHYIEEVKQLCSRVAIIDKGRILDDGTPNELLHRHPGFENLEQLFLHLTDNGREISPFYGH